MIEIDKNALALCFSKLMLIRSGVQNEVAPVKKLKIVEINMQKIDAWYVIRGR